LGRQVGATRRHGDPQALVNDSYGWPQLLQNLCRVVGATGHLVVGGRAQLELLVIAASEHRVAIIGGRRSAYEWAALVEPLN
jgi:hypothetical protein